MYRGAWSTEDGTMPLLYQIKMRYKEEDIVTQNHVGWLCDDRELHEIKGKKRERYGKKGEI